MQSAYAARFEREMGCTETQWLMWLPAAVGERAWELGASTAHVKIGPGTLTLHWRTGEPRAIALIRMPRLHVTFDFEGVGAGERLAFMKRFDLYMQRGGG